MENKIIDDRYLLSNKQLLAYIKGEDYTNPLSDNDEKVSHIVEVVNETINNLIKEADFIVDNLLHTRGSMSYQEFIDNYGSRFNVILCDSIVKDKHFRNDGWHDKEVSECLNLEVYILDGEKQYILLGIYKTLKHWYTEFDYRHNIMRAMLLLWAYESFLPILETVDKRYDFDIYVYDVREITSKLGIIGYTPMLIKSRLSELDIKCDDDTINFHISLMNMLVNSVSYKDLTASIIDFFKDVKNTIACTMSAYIDDKYNNSTPVFYSDPITEITIENLESHIPEKVDGEMIYFFKDYPWLRTTTLVLLDSVISNLNYRLEYDRKWRIHPMLGKLVDDKYTKDIPIYFSEYPFLFKSSYEDMSEVWKCIKRNYNDFNVDEHTHKALIQAKTSYVITTLKIALDIIRWCDMDSYREAVSKIYGKK